MVTEATTPTAFSATADAPAATNNFGASQTMVIDTASNTAAVLAAKGSSTNNFQVIDLSSGTRQVLNNENVQQNVQKTAKTTTVQTTQYSANYTRKL
jgi:pyruvate/2-oxoglutarate/acetoin dehydrogenase E1 component